MIPEYLISFDTKNLIKEKVDFLIVGGGFSGLFTALQLKDFKTLILYKDGIDQTCSYHAQGGIAVALSENDSPAKHKEDTLRTGCYINNEEAVNILVNEGIERIKELIDMGFKFDRDNGK
jgi:Aspartate oxidase